MFPEWRFEEAPHLRPKVARLSPGEAVGLHERVRQLVPLGAPEPSDLALDISDLDPPAVRDFLRGLPVPDQEPVLIEWAAQSDWSLACDFGTVTDHYDDLWYPSSDDMIVVPRTSAWVLVLDHEEHLVFRRLK